MKILTLALALAASTAASAQTYNLFPGQDGWLWFNTDEVINTYVGLINEDDYKPATGDGAKMVQLVYADQMPDYPASTASASVVGIGTDGEEGGEGSTTGALVLQPSSAKMNANGGGFVLALPSCSTLSIDYSCGSKVMGRLYATCNPNATMGQTAVSYDLSSDQGWKIISAKYMTVFKTLPYGHNQWTDMEQLSNGTDETTIQSDQPIYVWFQSAINDDLYIHGIKVTTPRPETAGIGTLATDDAPCQYYTADGRRVSSPTAKGLYIVRRGAVAHKAVLGQ